METHLKQAHGSRGMSRREWLRWAALSGAGLAIAACAATPATQQPVEAPAQPDNQGQKEQAPTQQAPQAENTQPEKPAAVQPAQPKKAAAEPSSDQAYLSVAHGQDPAAITEAALKALGGIERFVKKGYDVIIKPNICTDYYPYEYGATTNPQVVATLVKLVLGAGAKRVRVMDSPFGGTAASAYARSGIEEAVKAAGAEMVVMNPNKFTQTKIPRGVSIQEWEIYQDVLSCDLMIDVPIAKHHSLARVTIASKNLMGVIQRRSSIHADMGQRLPDLISVIQPGLTVVDAVRTLMDHGPTGGNLDDVKINNMVIASHDIVAADAYAVKLFDLEGKDIPYIQKAADMGLGTLDLSSIKIEEVTL